MNIASPSCRQPAFSLPYLVPMNEFKIDALERLIEQHKDRLGKVACLSIRRTIEQGAAKLDLQALNKLCRDLQCLPTDILRAV
jgi:hypothetical protein